MRDWHFLCIACVFGIKGEFVIHNRTKIFEFIHSFYLRTINFSRMYTGFWYSLLIYVFIMNAIIMIFFSYDWDVGLLYISTIYELNRCTNNGDLISDTKKDLKHTETETDTLPI